MIRRVSKAISVLLPGAILAFAGGALAADLNTMVEQCAACHGKNGASTEPSIPTIGGYSQKYIAETIRNFRKKIRACGEVTIPSGPKKGARSDMCKSTADLTEADIDALARHYAAQRFVPARQAFDKLKAERGMSVYKVRCQKCHEDNGSSPAEDNGILAGQWMPYLRTQLEGFRTGRRPIDDKMKLRLDKVTKEDEEALLHFFASQQ